MRSPLPHSLVARVAAAALVLVALSAAALADASTKTVDTGLGFTIAVPTSWIKGTPSGNNKFIIGSEQEDFALIVTDFGPAQADEGAALAIYRESFAKSGFALQTEADATIAGKPSKRLVFVLETANGKAHAEVAMVNADGETYAILVVTPLEQIEARRATIARIFDSVALTK
jgi:hypothetical protein